MVSTSQSRLVLLLSPGVSLDPGLSLPAVSRLMCRRHHSTRWVFYGPVVAFEMDRENDIVADLNRGKVHAKLLAQLVEEEITPRTSRPIAHGFLPRQWELYTNDDQVFTIIDEDDELHVLRPDKTFFIYATLTAASWLWSNFRSDSIHRYRFWLWLQSTSHRSHD